MNKTENNTKIVPLLGGCVLSVQKDVCLCKDDGRKHKKGDKWRSVAAYLRFSDECKVKKHKTRPF